MFQIQLPNAKTVALYNKCLEFLHQIFSKLQLLFLSYPVTWQPLLFPPSFLSGPVLGITPGDGDCLSLSAHRMLNNNYRLRMRRFSISTQHIGRSFPSSSVISFGHRLMSGVSLGGATVFEILTTAVRAFSASGVQRWWQLTEARLPRNQSCRPAGWRWISGISTRNKTLGILEIAKALRIKNYPKFFDGEPPPPSGVASIPE